MSTTTPHNRTLAAVTAMAYTTKTKMREILIPTKATCHKIIGSYVSAALISAFLCVVCCSLSVAQDTRFSNSFTWKKDMATGKDIAASRSDTPFNFFDVGDLSYNSLRLIEQDIRRIAAAAGLTIERGPAKNSTIAIIHDTKVYHRLKSDKLSFKPLGLPESVLSAIEKQTTDTSRCTTFTLIDGAADIRVTVVLLSEKFDSCLTRGLLNSFGSAASEINAETLMDVCVLYEGRRLGLRDRQSLTQEAPRLRNLCLAKVSKSYGENTLNQVLTAH